MIETYFFKDALTQAKAIASQQNVWERPQIQGFTNDGATSLDLDDAIWIEETERGATISVHIADVEEHIPLNSPLDLSEIATTQTHHNCPCI